MPLSRDDLERRLIEADRARLALRRTTRELEALRPQVVAARGAQHGSDRPQRSDRRPPGGG